MWTRLEFKSANAGAIFGDPAGDAYVLPLRLDDTELPGLHPTVGYLDLRDHDVREVVELLAKKIGLPMDGDEEDTAEIVGIDETLAICRTHIAPRMNANALQQFSADLRKHILFVRPRQAQQLIAGMIAELLYAERLRRDKTRHDTDALVDGGIARLEAAMRALADLSGQTSAAAPRGTEKNRRGRLIALAVGGVLAIAIGLWFAIDEFVVSADDRSSTRDPVSTTSGSSTAPKRSPSTGSSNTTTPSTVGGSVPGGPAVVRESPTPVATSTNQAEPPNPPAAPQQLSQGSIALAPTEGLDLDANEDGHQDDPGIDVSPSENGSQIYGMSHGKPKLAVVTSPNATGPELCETVAADAWRTPLPGLYGMSVGDRICVLTDRGNYGVLTLRTVPSAGAVDLDVDYIAWAR